jgi:3'-phosphoadenosine 5'-phosphosulfate (PAPS) 3'-phosphatase
MTAMLVLCGNCISTQPEHSAHCIALHRIASHRNAKAQQQKATAPQLIIPRMNTSDMKILIIVRGNYDHYS